MFYVEPVLDTYIEVILQQVSRGPLNDDNIATLSSMRAIAQDERVTSKLSEQRALRALEISFSLAVGVQHYKIRGWKPDPRFDISNLNVYEAILQEIYDRGVVYFVEAALQSDPLTEGIKPITKTKVHQASQVAELVMGGMKQLREILVQGDHWRYAAFGQILASSAQIMSASLTDKVVFANELRIQ